LTATSFAGERAGAFSVSPFVGGYTFDGVQHRETSPVYGLRLGYDLTNNWGVEGVGDYLMADGTHNRPSANAVSYRLDILYNFMPEGRLVPYLAIGGGGITAGHGSTFKPVAHNTEGTFNAGGGLKYFLTDSVALRGDARQLVVFDHQYVLNWEYTAGVTFLFGGNKPAAAPVPPPEPECNLSASPASIMQGQSAKLNWTSRNATAVNIKPSIGPVDLQGNMTVSPAADILYTLTCTGEGGKASSDATISVVPTPKPLAPTCDLSVSPASITKGESAKLNWTSQNATECDIQPGIGPVKAQGVADIKPAANTTYSLVCTGPGGKANSSAGITVAAPIMVDLCMTLNIEYDTDKSIIKPAYFGEVEKVANFMKRFPQIKGTIEGHTDNVASAKYNIKLSQRRAEGVVKMLVEKYGIDKSRLAAKGYGLTRPIADNKTIEGRQKNRRTVANFGCVTVEK
jgi:OOP family OmpA-OmpF porin